MSIIVKINGDDKSNFVSLNSLSVKQNLTSQVDTASFKVQSTLLGDFYVPNFGDHVEVFDGSSKIFGGYIIKLGEEVKSSGGLFDYAFNCIDYTFDLDKLNVGRTYENMTVKAIIADMLASYAPDFNADNVMSEFVIEKIVFNQVKISDCISKLAKLLGYEWYVDENKSINFFGKFTKTAPFVLNDTDGNHVFGSLKINLDGSQVVNRVKVRGGEYEGDLYTDVITVKGNDSKSFKLPYKMSNVSVSVSTGGAYVAKTVGIDFIDDFTSKDVLHNYQDQMVRFENALGDGNKIQFSGNPKVRVFAIAEDPASIENYGKIEKLVRDTSIQSNTIARRRASAELYAYADATVDASFFTYKAGLRSGMVIEISSAKMGISKMDLIIKSVTFKAVTPTEFGYQVDCISSEKYNLIELLQKLLEPDATPMDETEVSEEIFMDTQVVSITDEVEFITPTEADEDVNIVENFAKDPLGAGVEPTWVLSPYIPTGQSDTKRAGRLGISMKLY